MTFQMVLSILRITLQSLDLGFLPVKLVLNVAPSGVLLCWGKVRSKNLSKRAVCLYVLFLSVFFLRRFPWENLTDELNHRAIKWESV